MADQWYLYEPKQRPKMIMAPRRLVQSFCDALGLDIDALHFDESHVMYAIPGADGRLRCVPRGVCRHGVDFFPASYLANGLPALRHHVFDSLYPGRFIPQLPKYRI